MADFEALAQAERVLSGAKDDGKDSRSHRDDRDRDRDYNRDGGRDRDRRRHDDRDRRDHDRRRDEDRYTPGRRDDYERRDRDRDRERYGGDRDRRRYDRHDDRRRDDRRHDDHRGGDRGGRGGGGGGGGRGRREEHGTPDRRSPTPEDAIPLSKRIRRASGWDVCAPGYEGYTAMQAKHTGMFNLPGANRTQVVPTIMGMSSSLPPIHYGQGSFAPGGVPNLARQSRRLYVGNITYEANETNLQEFFNRKMIEMKIGTGGAGDPVIGVQINHEKSYAFVEFRSAEDATAAMAFDGIMFQSGPLKIRRPKDYTGSDLSAPMGVHVPGVVSTNVPDSINKIFVGGLPTYLDENQVMELLKSFGELKAFNLVRENGNASQGFAFFEYVDPSVTDIAIQGLNGMELGDRFLVVQRASVGAKQGIPGVPPELFAPAIPRPIMPITDATDPNPNDATILLLLNMVAPEDLTDDGEYEEIVEDVRDECSKFGPVHTLAIPRPAKKEKSKWDANAGALVTAGGAVLAPGAVGASGGDGKTDEQRGVGRVYIKFVSPEGASAALRGLAGRAFAGRSIIATLLADDADHSPPLYELFPNDVPKRAE